MKTAPMILALVVMPGLAACTRDPAPDAGTSVATTLAAAVDAALPVVMVYKSPTCGCCESWVGHMRGAGFPVEIRDTQDLDAIKTEVGVPFGQGSCHTAKVGDYFVEGHVPADDVKRLLTERPEARGLAVPGMPVGSPGMEQGDARVPYDVLLVRKDGSTTLYQSYP